MRFALGFACLAAWALVLGLLPPHEEISAAPGAFEVSEREITYDGAPVRLRGVATEDVRDLHLKGRDPASEYASMANNWRANVVRISVHPSTWRYHETETLELLKEHVGAATDAGLFVIVDYHVIGFPDGYYQSVPPEWGDPPDFYFSLATDFWDAVSTGVRMGVSCSSSGTSRSSKTSSPVGPRQLQVVRAKAVLRRAGLHDPPEQQPVGDTRHRQPLGVQPRGDQ